MYRRKFDDECRSTSYREYLLAGSDVNNVEGISEVATKWVPPPRTPPPPIHQIHKPVRLIHESNATKVPGYSDL